MNRIVCSKRQNKNRENEYENIANATNLGTIRYSAFDYVSFFFFLLLLLFNGKYGCVNASNKNSLRIQMNYLLFYNVQKCFSEKKNNKRQKNDNEIMMSFGN